MRPIARGLVMLALTLPGTGRAATMSDLARVWAEMDCARLSAVYAEGIDTLNPALFASVFTSDAVWITGAGEIRGRDAIAHFITTRPIISGKHSITNILITVTDENHAQGTAYLVNYHWDTAHPETVTSLSPNLVGKFTDSFVRENGHWLIRSRVLDKVNPHSSTK